MGIMDPLVNRLLIKGWMWEVIVNTSHLWLLFFSTLLHFWVGNCEKITYGSYLSEQVSGVVEHLVRQVDLKKVISQLFTQITNNMDKKNYIGSQSHL